MRLVMVAAVGLFVGFCQRAGAPEVLAQAPDFGFRFQFGMCMTSTFDTFTGVFTRELGGDPPRSVTTSLSLSDAQMVAIRRTLDKIRFFDYPNRFIGVPAGLRSVVSFHPANNYRLEVQRGQNTHAVSWQDSQRPSTDEADRLRNLLAMIVGFISDHPAVKQLPPPIGGCE